MSRPTKRSSHAARPTVVFGALAAVQIAVVAVLATRPDDGRLWFAGMLTIIGAGVVMAGYGHRLARARNTVRREIDVLAEQPLNEMLADALRSRDVTEFRKLLPVASDAGLARLTDGIEAACVTALQTSAEHEDLRVGYTEVFVNMFRRTQTLLQRQLQVIERLEQGNRTPQDMHLLFQLDHLVTRMRRNNENVLVLAGTELVRATKNPVTIADVFRAAMSEVDKYQKIRVLGTPSVRVSNTAAGDLIRIIAELLDNATSFSAPDKEVTINAELGRHQGLSISVFDNGIGMSDEDIRRVNDQLKKLGSVEIARSRRVGLFVVGRLAGRNGFKVELFGGDKVEGVSALVSVPSSVLLEEDALRATLPGDSQRVPVGATASGGGTAVAVRTSLRRSGVTQSTATSRPESRRMSSWHNRSQTWRAERDNARTASTDVNLTAERIDRTHADVPEVLPTRVPGQRITTPPVESPELAGAQQPEPDHVQRAAPPADDSQETRVASRWFRARGGTESAAPDGTDPSSANETEQLADVEENSYSYTEDGLPLRRQGAHLQRAIAETEPEAVVPEAVTPVERDPAQMRRRLSSYQLGVRKAKEQEDLMRGNQQHTGGWTVLERKATK